MIDLSTALLPANPSPRALRLASPDTSAFAMAMQTLAATGGARIAAVGSGDVTMAARPLVAAPASAGAVFAMPTPPPAADLALSADSAASVPHITFARGVAAPPRLLRDPTAGARSAIAMASGPIAQATRQAVADAGSGLPDDAIGSLPSDGEGSTNDAGSPEEVASGLVAYGWFPTPTPTALPAEHMPAAPATKGRSPGEVGETPQIRSVVTHPERQPSFPAVASSHQTIGDEAPSALTKDGAQTPAAPNDASAPKRAIAEPPRPQPAPTIAVADAPHAPDARTLKAAPIALPSPVSRDESPAPSAAMIGAGQRVSETKAVAPPTAAAAPQAAWSTADAGARAISPPVGTVPKGAPPALNATLRPATETNKHVRGSPVLSPAAAPASPAAPALVAPAVVETDATATPLTSEPLLLGRRTAPGGASSDLAGLGGLTEAPRPVGTNAPARVEHDTIDLRRDDWTGRMVDHIEALRDAAPSGETRIRLAPEMLGPVDIAIRQEGDRVHVQFTAESPAARQALSDAQPRLAELAEARGVRLGQTSVDGGTGQGNPGQRHDTPGQPTRPARTPLRDEASPSGDDRIA